MKNLHLVLRYTEYLGSNPAGNLTCNFFASPILLNRGTQFHPTQRVHEIENLLAELGDGGRRKGSVNAISSQTTSKYLLTPHHYWYFAALLLVYKPLVGYLHSERYYKISMLSFATESFSNKPAAL